MTHDTTTRSARLSGRVLAALAFCVWCCGGVPAFAQAPDDAADAARLAELLNLHDGSVVADIGAGLAPLTVLISPYVGTSGRVYSTDLEPARLTDIQSAATKAGLHNVTVVQGAPSATSLPANSCDGIFMRDVYHHFGDPPTMNASLLHTLKPGGHLAISDFAPRSGRTASPGKRDQGADHGILPADIIRELEAAGFANVHQATWPSAGYFVIVGERPAR